jgi:hypothetical protein
MARTVASNESTGNYNLLGVARRHDDRTRETMATG